MKILMATMSMGLGGAETHVLELSLELARRGHCVFVASDGGEYVPLLEAGGVEHISVPLHSKDPRCVAKAKKRLSELMKKERFDIVHAHARIPAFICGELKKKYGYVFVTTAHFDFKVNALLARITDWGDHVLAVSEDIADSVVQKYGYQRKNITIVNNGIDTSRFSPRNNGEKVRKALCIGDKKIVMYLGRLDNDSSRGAKALLESALLLYEKNKDVRVVIVGNGENLDEMRVRAEDINNAVGEKIVLLPRAFHPETTAKRSEKPSVLGIKRSLCTSADSITIARAAPRHCLKAHFCFMRKIKMCVSLSSATAKILTKCECEPKISIMP